MAHYNVYGRAIVTFTIEAATRKEARIEAEELGYDLAEDDVQFSTGTAHVVVEEIYEISRDEHLNAKKGS